jgi:hypothetical protein
MPTPKNGYFLKDNTRAPSVTQIIGRFKESGALINRAFREGVEQGRARVQVPNLYRKKAAEIGTTVHKMVELVITDTHPIEGELRRLVAKLPDKAMRESAWEAFNAFLSWEEDIAVKYVDQEIGLVSERHRYGGTIDAIGHVNGAGAALLDWKTSSRVHTDHLIQLAVGKRITRINRSPEDFIYCGSTSMVVVFDITTTKI